MTRAALGPKAHRRGRLPAGENFKFSNKNAEKFLPDIEMVTCDLEESPEKMQSTVLQSFFP